MSDREQSELADWSAEDLVSYLRNCREYIENKTKELKERLKPYAMQEAEIEGEIIRRCNEQNRNNQRTNFGTAYLYDKVSVTVSDRAAFRDWLLADPEDHMIFADIRASKTAVNEAVAEGEPLPPGVARTVIVAVGLKKAD